MLTFDFETEAIEGNPIANPPRPVGVALKWDDKPSEYLAWGHPTGNNCTWEGAFAALDGAFMQRGINGSTYLAHNAPFDLAVLRKSFGICVDLPLQVHDTQYLVFLHDPYAHSFSLKPSAERILGLPPDEQDELKAWIVANVPGATKSNFGAHISKAPGELVGRYACGDTDRTYALFQYLHPRIVEQGMEGAYQREQRLAPILSESSRRGVRVDVERLGEDVARYQAAKREAEQRIFAVLGEFNLDADQELADRLDAAGQIERWVYTAPTKRHPEGQRSVSRKNLRIKDKSLGDLLAYRGVLSTCLGTFAEPWLAAASATGRLHPQWNQVRGDRTGDISGTRTGRMSCIAGGELVQTERGRVPIAEVAVGDYVLTHKLRYRQVVRTIRNGPKVVYRYSLSNGDSVVCTADHRFFSSRGWSPIWSIADECVKEMGGSPRERFESSGAVQGCSEASFGGGSGGGVGHDVPQCPSLRTPAPTLGEENSPEPSPFGGQGGGEEPDGTEDGAGAPRVEGRLFGWSRVPDEVGGWGAGIRTQGRGSQAAGVGETPGWGCGAPHRLRPDEQPPGQSGDLHGQGAQEHPQLDGFCGVEGITVTKVEFIGVREVFDLTVDEDHSFGVAGVFAHNCNAPNLQNIPNEFEGLVVPEGLLPPIRMRRYLLPEEGHVWCKRDFSAQEMRILAHYTEGRLYQAFRDDPRTDPHTATRKAIMDAVGIDIGRPKSKGINFSKIYGQGKAATAAALGVSLDEVVKFIDAYDAAMPEILQLSRATKRRGSTGGFIRTWGGRVYYTEQHPERDLSYKLLNYLCQGSAADQTKQAIIDWYDAKPSGNSLIAAVHDEVNISVPSDSVPDGMRTLREQMDADRFDVPFRSEGFVGPNWADIQEYEDDKSRH